MVPFYGNFLYFLCKISWEKWEPQRYSVISKSYAKMNFCTCKHDKPFFNIIFVAQRSTVCISESQQQKILSN